MGTKAINIKETGRCFLLTSAWFCLFFVPTFWEYLRGDMAGFFFKECDNDMIHHRFILLLLAFMFDVTIQVAWPDFGKSKPIVLMRFFYRVVFVGVLGVFAIMLFFTLKSPNIILIFVTATIVIYLKFRELKIKTEHANKNKINKKGKLAAF